MSEWNIARVNVGKPLRGGGQQEAKKFVAQAMSFTWSWGSQPAEGRIKYVAPNEASIPMIVPGASMQVAVFGKTFYGIATEGTVFNADAGLPEFITKTEQGFDVEIPFVDYRYLLEFDRVFCSFNNREKKIVQGRWVRRYWHMLPVNFNSWIRTYTLTPYSARQIVQFLLGAPTVEIRSWVGLYHPDMERPIYFTLDWLQGPTLGEALQEISDDLGLLMTLQNGPFRLEWARKGEGVLPPIPPNASPKKISQVLSGNATRIFVVGDQNLYLVLNVPMSPDWNRNWEEILLVDGLADDLFNHEADPTTGAPYNAIPGDVEFARGRMLAAARAREITVREYAALRAARDGKDFRDVRKFAGRSRMELPAAIYLQEILFRAFRPPATIKIGKTSRPTHSMKIVDDAMAKVTHDPATGVMSATIEEVQGGNGYAIARGYKVTAELLTAIRPERFRLDDFQASQNLWQSMTFQVDDDGEDGGTFILFDEPIVRSANMLQVIDGYAVLNAYPAFQIPEVRAALTFEAEKFMAVYGNSGRDESVYVSGLRKEAIVNGETITEVPFDDGSFSEQHAEEIARPLLGRPYTYIHGGYTAKLQDGEVIPSLNGMMHRIEVQCSAEGGFVCSIEFSNERPLKRRTQLLRDMDRAVRQRSLLPGQHELKEQSKVFRALATAFKQSPGIVRSAGEFLRTRVGANVRTYPVLIGESSGTLAAGVPIWKAPNPTSTLAVMPAQVTEFHQEFCGVTLRQGEKADGTLRLQKTGQMLARVLGPVEVGDTVGRANGADYLVGSTENPVGTVEQAIESEEVKLIPVLAAGAGGEGEGKDFEWL